MEKRQTITPSFGLALGLFLTIVGILSFGKFTFGINLHTLMLLSIVVGAVAAYKFGHSWAGIEAAIFDQIRRSMGAIIIMMLIGAIIGTFIQCGAVPALFYYGLKIISPTIFLPACLLICSLMSIATGTSWGTIGTIGLAMMGIGTSIGIPPAVTAGSVVAGAFFGDKMSPLSDTTNLAAAVVETNLYDHIRAMMYSAVPAYILSIIISWFVGMQYGGGTADLGQIAKVETILAGQFNLNVMVLAPMVVVFGLSFIRVPAIPSMVLGILVACGVSVIFQGESLQAAFGAINSGFKMSSDLELVNKLLSRGGIQSMMWTVSLILLALSLGGVLEKARIMEVIISKATKNIERVGSLVTVGIISSILVQMATTVIYFSIVLNGRLFKKSFEKMKLKRRMLSRVVEEGATMADPLIPWTTSGIFVYGVLGVGAWEYAPFCFNNYLTPIISIAMCYMGYSILYKSDDTEETEETEFIPENEKSFESS